MELRIYIAQCINQVWWSTPVMPALQKLEARGSGVQGHPWHPIKFETSLGYGRASVKSECPLSQAFSCTPLGKMGLLPLYTPACSGGGGQEILSIQLSCAIWSCCRWPGGGAKDSQEEDQNSGAPSRQPWGSPPACCRRLSGAAVWGRSAHTAVTSHFVGPPE